MITVQPLLQLHDLDLMLDEARDAASRARLRSLGLAVPDEAPVYRVRARFETEVDRRFAAPYERARARYGRGLAVLRDRVCLGCFVTMPRSTTPEPGGVSTCVSCGRLLWRR